MPYIIESDPEILCLRITFSGSVDLSQCLDMLREQATYPEAGPDLRVACDLTDTQPAISYDGMWEVFMFVKEHLDEYVGQRWALIAPDLLQYGLARMAVALLEGLPVSIQVFREPHGAYFWLGVPMPEAVGQAAG